MCCHVGRRYSGTSDCGRASAYGGAYDCDGTGGGGGVSDCDGTSSGGGDDGQCRSASATTGDDCDQVREETSTSSEVGISFPRRFNDVSGRHNQCEGTVRTKGRRHGNSFTSMIVVTTVTILVILVKLGTNTKVDNAVSGGRALPTVSARRSLVPIRGVSNR